MAHTGARHPAARDQCGSSEGYPRPQVNIGGALLVTSNLADKQHDASQELGVLNRHECLDECKTVRRGEEGGHIGWRGCLSDFSWLSWRTSKKEVYGDLEKLCDVLQSARAYSVRALLILLNLLERDTERVTQRLLAPAATTTGASVPTRPARTATEKWYPDHAVLSATKDQLKSMTQFKYN